MSKSGFRDSPPAPRCAVNSCYRLDQLNLRMVGCKVVLRNEMISYSCFATLMRSVKSLKQAFYQHENNSTSSDGLMDACLYGDVAQWLERGKLINLRGRGFESFHLHDYIATPYSSKIRSSNIWKVGLLWHHGRVWFIANGLNPFVPQGTGGSNPPDVVSFSRRACN